MSRPPEPKPEHLATPRNVHVAAWAVAFTWLSAVVATVVALLTRNWPEALMALVAAINAAGWWTATRRWVEWSTVAVGLMATLEAMGVTLWLEPPDDDEVT